MKLNIFIALLIAQCVCIQTAVSQRAASQKAPNKFGFGIELQPKFGTYRYSGTDLFDSESAINFSIGGMIYYKLTNHLELQSGISYSQMNNNFRYNSFTVSCDIQLIFPYYLDDKSTGHFITLPLALQVALTKTENNLYFRPGIEGLFKFGQKSESNVPPCNEDENLSFTYNFFALKVITGIGYEFKLFDTKRLFIEPQLSYSTNSLMKEPGRGSVHLHSKNLQSLEVGIRLGVKF